jgi:uncharacterized protein YprB with RNaseH-like and TPR domain
MLQSIPSDNILFLDIETVPQHATYNEVDERMQALWNKKAALIARDSDATPSELYERAGIYAEFGKIVCISVGLIVPDGLFKNLKIKSFAGDDEQQLLLDFAELLNKSYKRHFELMCGHNAKEFDFPYIARRMLINGIALPQVINLHGKKPWEIPHLDTLELWKFGDYKNYTSLDLLAAVFNVETPKDDINGSQVYGVYYKEQNLQRIVEYCQKDVVTLVNVFLKMKGDEPILPRDIILPE